MRLLKSNDVPEWIHSPIGLDIQAEGPEEITVSILAELIKIRNSARKKRGSARVHQQNEVLV